MEQLKILIADDHPLVRAGVAATLEPYPEMSVVGQARSGDEVLDLLGSLQCDLLILDLNMQGPDAETVIRASQELQPDLKILILSSHTEAKYLGPLRESSICGFVLKDEAPDCLLQAIRVVATGSVWFSHAILEKNLELNQQERMVVRAQRLTSREQQVLEKIREAKDNQTIADELSISKQTVRRYATLIYEKLGVKGRIEAIVSERQW